MALREMRHDVVRAIDDGTGAVCWAARDGAGALTKIADEMLNINTVAVTSSENLAKVNNAAVDVGAGAPGAGTQRVSVADRTLLAWGRITIGASATIASLVAGAALNAAVKRLTIIPEAGAPVIYANKGAAATASTGQVPPGGLALDVLKAAADTLYIYAASAAYAVVVQEG